MKNMFKVLIYILLSPLIILLFPIIAVLFISSSIGDEIDKEIGRRRQ